jgi:hypothetical protein
MEESVTLDIPNELIFSFFGMALSAKGLVALVMAGAVSVLIIAVAWRLVKT